MAIGRCDICQKAKHLDPYHWCKDCVEDLRTLSSCNRGGLLSRIDRPVLSRLGAGLAFLVGFSFPVWFWLILDAAAGSEREAIAPVTSAADSYREAGL